MLIPTLTLQQPFASFISWEEKLLETRSWKPSLAPGSLLAIHAGKMLFDMDDWCEDDISRIFAALERHGHDDWCDLPRGAVLCIAQLQGIYPTEAFFDWSRLTPAVAFEEFAFGDFTEGRWAWYLRVLHVFSDPVPARGHQSIWQWELSDFAVLDVIHSRALLPIPPPPAVTPSLRGRGQGGRKPLPLPFSPLPSREGARG